MPRHSPVTPPVWAAQSNPPNNKTTARRIRFLIDLLSSLAANEQKIRTRPVSSVEGILRMAARQCATRMKQNSVIVLLLFG
jgi:hypothetical protein